MDWAAMLQKIIHFEDFELDPGSFELRRAGQLVKVERIPLQLLFLLAENRDHLVTREEILEAIWGKNQFVDADNSINTAVRKIRQALRDDPEKPRFLRTVSGKGYRFTAQVQTAPSPAPLENVESTRPSVDAAYPSLRRAKWAILGAVVLVAMAGSLLLLRSRSNPPAKPVQRKAMLVVLPFVDLSQAPGEDYLADGMTEEIITQLGGLEYLYASNSESSETRFPRGRTLHRRAGRSATAAEGILLFQ
jgi:DNA-binding winged helix-turn-helix (wHTH) protein